MKKRIRLIIISILFILSSIFIINQVYDNYQDEKVKKEKEAERFRVNSYNEISNMLSYESYMFRKYDLDNDIRVLALENSEDPLINYKFQKKLRDDFSFLGVNDSEFFIINKKRGQVIKPNSLDTVESFFKEYNLEELDGNQFYKKGGDYFFINKSNIEGIYYILVIKAEFFTTKINDERYGKWYFLYNGKIINYDGTSIEIVKKGMRRFNPLRKNIEIYYVEYKTENFIYSVDFIKDIVFYLLINLMFIIIITKLLLAVAYQPIRMLISKVDYEKPDKEDELLSIENIYDKLKTENDLLKSISKRTTEITQGKELVDYIKGTLDYEHLTHPFKKNIKKYKMLVGIVEINDYSDDKVISFKQDISKIMSEKYNGIFLLADRGEILLLMENKCFNFDKLKKDLYNLDEKYDMNIKGFISNKEFYPKELYNKYICFKNFLDYKFILREKKIITESDIDNVSIRNYYYPIELERNIIHFILDKKIDQIRYLYKELLNENFVQRKISSSKFEKLKVLITNTIRRMHEEMPRNKRIEERYLKNVINSKTQDELFLNINKMIEVLLENIPETEKREVDQLIQKIDDFIAKNYSKEVSLLDFAEYMGITLQYASNLYKKLKGDTFNKSLGKYRIEKAIELYSHDKTLKIKDISTMVGYSNTITFINNFKKIKNMTPKKYFTEIL